MLSPRAGALVAAAGVLFALSACSPAPPGGVDGSSTQGSGLAVVTAGGTALVDGENDVPPTLDLRVVLPAGTTAEQVSARLDGSPLALQAAAGAVTAQVPPMPLGSAHALDLALPGRSPQHIGFHVAAPAG